MVFQVFNYFVFCIDLRLHFEIRDCIWVNVWHRMGTRVLNCIFKLHSQVVQYTINILHFLFLITGWCG
ncbi:hypothetical protein HALLA_05735 [Halostagnicola larsenii XH-48]|uniref:Uncharacterized protein n=1 Tax=Halostagnicola larsenii XH-48 TaxID=797299 RepID=W0JPS1_9EURY|nr:hypothetical protein HALLA_05735 [Halostagnicola larsenii XH-48]